jgi:MFS family permease
LFVVGHLQLDGPKLESIKASAILADCYEAFGAIIGVLAVGFIAFEVPERQLLEGPKSRQRMVIALGILLTIVITSRYVHSSGLLYLLRVLTGLFEGAYFLGYIVRLAHLK